MIVMDANPFVLLFLKFNWKQNFFWIIQRNVPKLKLLLIQSGSSANKEVKNSKSVFLV